MNKLSAVPSLRVLLLSELRVLLLALAFVFVLVFVLVLAFTLFAFMVDLLPVEILEFNWDLLLLLLLLLPTNILLSFP